MKYYIQAKQGDDRFFLTKRKVAKSPRTKGFLYDRKKDIFEPVGIEIFKGGYWESASGTMELPAK